MVGNNNDWLDSLEHPEQVEIPPDLLPRLLADVPSSEELRALAGVDANQKAPASEEAPVPQSLHWRPWALAAALVLAALPVLLVQQVVKAPPSEVLQADADDARSRAADVLAQPASMPPSSAAEVGEVTAPTGEVVTGQKVAASAVGAVSSAEDDAGLEPLRYEQASADPWFQEVNPKREADMERIQLELEHVNSEARARPLSGAEPRVDLPAPRGERSLRQKEQATQGIVGSSDGVSENITVTSDAPMVDTFRIASSATPGIVMAPPVDLPRRRPAPDAMFFDRRAAHRFVDPTNQPLSTFSLDVDTGSFTLARRYLLEEGMLPPPQSIRIEEWVNYFETQERPPRRGDFRLTVAGAPIPAGMLSGREATTAARQRHLVRIGVRARDVKPERRPPVTLTFLVDTSGSMARENRLELVKRSLDVLLDELHDDDKVGLVTYSSTAREVLEPTSDRAATRVALARLHPEQSTNLEDGMRLAYAMAARNASRGVTSRVILCSDGVANVGATNARSILETVADAASAGIEMVAVGFGMGNYNDALLEQLADRGDGSYAYVDDLREATRVFGEKLTGLRPTIASDARVQVEWNADAVLRYRQLGYENRELPPEAFRDPQTDAGEVAAGHQVTVLYEVELLRGSADIPKLADVRLRYRSKKTGSFEEIEKEVTRRELTEDWESANADLRLAGTVALVADSLRDGQDGGEQAKVLVQAQKGLAALEGAFRPEAAERVLEFEQMVERARRILAARY